MTRRQGAASVATVPFCVDALEFGGDEFYILFAVNPAVASDAARRDFPCPKDILDAMDWSPSRRAISPTVGICWEMEEFKMVPSIVVSAALFAVLRFPHQTACNHLRRSP